MGAVLEPDMPVLKRAAGTLGFTLYEETGIDVLVAKCDVCGRELVFHQRHPDHTPAYLEMFLEGHRAGCRPAPVQAR